MGGDRQPLPWARMTGERGAMDTIFVSELVGTAILILLGDGVVAAVLLNHSKAQNSGWIVDRKSVV